MSISQEDYTKIDYFFKKTVTVLAIILYWPRLVVNMHNLH